MTDYQLTDEEIKNAIYEDTRERNSPWPEKLTPRDRLVADAASKKARNETIKEVKAWLEALENTLGIYDNELGFVEISNHVPFSAWTALIQAPQLPQASPTGANRMKLPEHKQGVKYVKIRDSYVDDYGVLQSAQYQFLPDNSVCGVDCPRCAVDAVIELIKQKRDKILADPYKFSLEAKALNELLKELEA